MSDTSDKDDDEYVDCTWTIDQVDACPYCSGNRCNIGHSKPYGSVCNHDSLERHLKREEPDE